MNVSQKVINNISRGIEDFVTFLGDKNELEENENQRLAAVREKMIDPEKTRKIAEYVETLYQENKKYNLIGPADRNEIVYLHILDSLIPLFYAGRLIEFAGKIGIDIGSGAGLPGLIWSIVLPESTVYLLDSRRKRVDFLRETVSKLNISDCRPLRVRAEKLGQEEDWREKFDFVLARAVAPLNILLEYSLPLLRIKGRAFLFKGPRYQEELEEGDAAAALLQGSREKIFKLEIPGLEGERYLLSYQKEDFCPKKYPRRVGIPEKRPLGSRS